MLISHSRKTQPEADRVPGVTAALPACAPIKSGDHIVTSVIQGCLGCGSSTEAPSPFCTHCAELVEYKQYDQTGTKNPSKLKSQKFRQGPVNLLTKMICSGPVLAVTLTGFLVTAAALCQSTSLGCRLFDHCLLS